MVAGSRENALTKGIDQYRREQLKHRPGNTNRRRCSPPAARENIASASCLWPIQELLFVVLEVCERRIAARWGIICCKQAIFVDVGRRPWRQTKTREYNKTGKNPQRRDEDHNPPARPLRRPVVPPTLYARRRRSHPAHGLNRLHPGEKSDTLSHPPPPGVLHPRVGRRSNKCHTPLTAAAPTSPSSTLRRLPLPPRPRRMLPPRRCAARG